MQSSIFIKTYEADLCWLEWCLKFLEKNWQEISTLSIVAPNNCMDRIRSFESVFNPMLYPVDEWPDGYLGQQYMKMTADRCCEGEYITFIDSDAMLIKPTVLADLFGADGPIIWYTSYSALPGVPWKKVVSEVMMLEPQNEFMRCHPITYHRDTLKRCRAHLEKKYGYSLEKIIQQRPPGSFSEFNVIGFYTWIYERENYSFRRLEMPVDWSEEVKYNTSRIRQFHSYSEWNEETPKLLADLLNSEPPPKIEVKEPYDAQLIICTWEPDLDWLEVAVKSVGKYWQSRLKPLIIATPQCWARLARLERTEALVKYEDQMVDHHRGQVYIKMTADLFSDADAILFMDSDCMFTRESSYHDFCVGGKPIIHYEDYSTLIPRSIPQDQNCFTRYREVVLSVMGIDAPAEYMRQHPFLFFRKTITATRALIEERMGKPLLDVMRTWHSGYFSEFNCLGAYAATFEGGKYHLAPVEAIDDRRVHQFHSWSQKPSTEPLVAKWI